jgi:hypothetical protein
MTMSGDPRLAAILESDHPWAKIKVLTNPYTEPPTVDIGPTLPTTPFKGYIEFSDDGERIAVSLGDRIEVFQYPGFELVATFDATNVQYMQFRPRVE